MTESSSGDVNTAEISSKKGAYLLKNFVAYNEDHLGKKFSKETENAKQIFLKILQKRDENAQTSSFTQEQSTLENEDDFLSTFENKDEFLPNDGDNFQNTSSFDPTHLSSEEDIKGKSLSSGNNLNEIEDDVYTPSKIEEIDSGPLIKDSIVTQLNKEKLEISKNTTVKKVAIYALGIGMGLGITYVGWKHSDTIISTMGNMMQSASNLVFWGTQKVIESIPEAPDDFPKKYPRVTDTNVWSLYELAGKSVWRLYRLPDPITEIPERVMQNERNLMDFNKLTSLVYEYSHVLFVGMVGITGVIGKRLHGESDEFVEIQEHETPELQEENFTQKLTDIEADEFVEIQEHETPELQEEKFTQKLTDVEADWKKFRVNIESEGKLEVQEPATMEDDLEEISEHNIHYFEQLKQIKGQIVEQEKHIKSLEENIQSVQQNIKDLENQKQSLGISMFNMNQTINDLENQKTRLSKDQISKDIKKANRVNDAIKNLSIKKKEVELLKFNIMELDEEISTYRLDLSSQEEELEKLKSSLVKLEKSFNDLRNET